MCISLLGFDGTIMRDRIISPSFGAFFGALFLVLSQPAFAQGAVVVEAGNQALRDDLQWLNDRRVIQLSTSTWPLPLSAIEYAMAHRKKENLSRADVNALLSVRKYLLSQQGHSFGLEVNANSSSVPQIGFSKQAKGAVQSGLYVQGSSEYFSGKLQANALLDPITTKQARGNLAGSYVSGRLLGQVVYVGQLDRWWGPGQDGSVNWGNSGTPIPGVGLQRGVQAPFESPFLSWLGPWNYDLFFGKMQHDQAVPGVKVIGMRLQIQPIQGLELGVSRLFQWGGGGRSESWSSFWNALRGNSNDLGRANDPSNELAGFDFRYTFPLAGNPATIYAQVAGEDEAGGLPSKYIALAGAQYKYVAGNTRVQWHVEAADTMARRLFGAGTGEPGIAYRHTNYRDGLYHDGLPIGHGIGGDGRLYSAGLTLAPDDFRYFSRYGFKLLYADVNPLGQSVNQAFNKSGGWYGGQAWMSWSLKSVILSAGLDVRRRREGNVDNAFSVMFSASVPLARF